MALRRTKIPYADYSGADLNFIIGCTPVSAGCENCYAERLVSRWQKKDFSEVQLYPEKLKRLVKANFEPEGHEPFRRGPGKMPICFPVDLGDLFHHDVPDDFLFEAFWTFDQHRYDAVFLILTKRAGRMHLFQQERLPAGYPPNCWMGVTAENQRMAVRRIPILLSTKCSMRWVSVEPMLEPVRLSCLEGLVVIDALQGLLRGDRAWGVRSLPRLNWVVVGAESGPNRRGFRPWWAESVWADCQKAGVPFFGKQDSGLRPGVPLLIHGREIKEFPSIDSTTKGVRDRWYAPFAEV